MQNATQVAQRFVRATGVVVLSGAVGVAVASAAMLISRCPLKDVA